MLFTVTVGASPGGQSRAHVGTWVILALGLVGLALAAAPGHSGQGQPLTYAASSTLALLITVICAATLLGAAGIAGILDVPRFSRLLGLLALAWLAPDVVGWLGGPPLLRSIALVSVPFAVPLVVHLSLALHDGTLGRRGDRLIVGLAYLGAILHGVGRALFRDPFLDLHCWNNCTDNVFLIRADPTTVMLLDRSWLVATVFLGGVVIALLASRVQRASAVTRHLRRWHTVGAISALASVIGFAILLWMDPAEDPTRPAFALAFLARGVGLTALAAGVVQPLMVARRRRLAVRGLADQLAAMPTPGALESLLWQAFGDPDLRLGYRVHDEDRWVDALGVAIDPTPQWGQVVSTIARNGDPVAILVHDAATSVVTDVEAQVGAAAELALDNERLRAEVASRTRELQASRGRIVAAADAARRAVERDLHDGAQQRLLAVSFELRLAASHAAGDVEAAATLGQASAAVMTAMADLRALAHGIFPAILEEAGLAEALASMATRARIPVTVDITGSPKGSDAATTVYAVVDRVVRWAESRGADRVDVQVTEVDGHGTTSAGVPVSEDEAALHLCLEVDGVAVETDELVHLRDRVGADGGWIDRDGSYLRAVVPCG